jgi:hypothetical protein
MLKRLVSISCQKHLALTGSRMWFLPVHIKTSMHPLIQPGYRSVRKLKMKRAKAIRILRWLRIY